MVVQANGPVKKEPSTTEMCKRYRMNSILWILATIAIAAFAIFSFRKGSIARGVLLSIPAVIGIYRIFYEGFSFGGRLAPWSEGAFTTCTGKDNPVLSKTPEFIY